MTDRPEKNETDEFRRAQATAEELEHDLQHQTPDFSGLPTAWKDKAGKTHLKGAPTQVVSPDRNQIALYGLQRAFVCGHCKYFDLETGRREIARQDMGRKIVREYGWQLKHMGATPDSMGLCGAGAGETITSYFSKGCDQFRDKRSKV